MEETLRLFDLNQYILQTIELNFGSDVWISCEFSNMKYSRGHYYVDLVDKDDLSDKIIAKSQAVIWKTNAEYIQESRDLNLEDLLGSGLEVRLKVRVAYHAIYGLKLTIIDLDPNYSIGRLEIKRKETLKQLSAENLIDKNKEIPLAPVIKNIAVISGAHAAGYIDFVNELQSNSYDYKFRIDLFEAALQGDKLVNEFLAAFKKIEKSKQYDVIVIIRGGGSKLDLAGFDEYELAKRIANAKFPVFTGIGHEIDLSIADLVSYKDFKTPTAVAGFIIEQNLSFESQIIRLTQEIMDFSLARVKSAELDLESSKQRLFSLTQMKIESAKFRLNELNAQVKNKALNHIAIKEKSLENLWNAIQLSSPDQILSKGYALVEQQGSRIQTIQSINHAEKINLIMKDGKLEVKSVKDE